MRTCRRTFKHNDIVFDISSNNIWEVCARARANHFCRRVYTYVDVLLIMNFPARRQPPTSHIRTPLQAQHDTATPGTVAYAHIANRLLPRHPRLVNEPWFLTDAVRLEMEAQLPSMSVPNWVTLITGARYPFLLPPNQTISRVPPGRPCLCFANRPR